MEIWWVPPTLHKWISAFAGMEIFCPAIYSPFFLLYYGCELKRRTIKMVNEITIGILIKQLSDKDGLVREKARLTLVDIGKETTLALTEAVDRQRPANALGSRQSTGSNRLPGRDSGAHQGAGRQYFRYSLAGVLRRWLVSVPIVSSLCLKH